MARPEQSVTVKSGLPAPYWRKINDPAPEPPNDDRSHHVVVWATVVGAVAAIAGVVVALL